MQKVWSARFAAHHPNVAVLDLSSFKCGHDAPTYGLVDSVINASGTPYSALHDIDANRPTGSIKIRVKTYAHSLSLHEERLQDASRAREELLPVWSQLPEGVLNHEHRRGVETSEVQIMGAPPRLFEELSVGVTPRAGLQVRQHPSELLDASLPEGSEEGDHAGRLFRVHRQDRLFEVAQPLRLGDRAHDLGLFLVRGQLLALRAVVQQQRALPVQ